MSDNYMMEREEIHSKVMRAGRRTYFFDVRSTKAGNYYLTITESKKRFGENGKYSYEKHKIFLYREDFTKFIESLQEVVDFIHDKQPEEFSEEVEPKAQTEEVAEEETVPEKDYTNVEFEDI